MKNKEEKIVYVIPFSEKSNIFTDEKFIKKAKSKGRIYNLLDFQIAFNMGEINSELDSIRFINI